MSDAAQTDTCEWPSTADGPDDFNSFQFWRIEPDVIDDVTVISACGDSLASLVISHSKHDSPAPHAVGDSLQQHSQGLPDSNHNVKQSTYSFYHFNGLIFRSSPGDNIVGTQVCLSLTMSTIENKRI